MQPTKLANKMAYAGLINPWRRPGTHVSMHAYVAAGGPFGAFTRVN